MTTPKIVKHTPFIWQYLDIASDREVELIRATGDNHFINNKAIDSCPRDKGCNNNQYDNIF